MPKLIIKKKSEIVQVIELERSKSVYTLGAAPDNDIALRSQPLASKQLRIERQNNSFYLEPLSETPPILINGRPLRYRLQFVHGDELSVGGLTITFDNKPYTFDSQSEEIEVIGEDDFGNAYHYPSAKPDGRKSSITDTVSVETTPAEAQTSEFYEIEALPEAPPLDSAAPQTKQNSRAQSAYSLVAVYGPYIGKKYPLNLGDTKIGRDNTLNDIVIRNTEKGALDPSISRRHATVSYRKNKFYVSDKRSKTRTYVNQVKLQPEDEYPVYEGDEIEIVSDQKSTILRMISRANPDLKPPKKAGTWWVRHAYTLAMMSSVVFALSTLVLLGISCQTRLAVTNKPDKLKVVEETWYQDEAASKQLAFARDRSHSQANLAAADLTGDGRVNVVFTDAAGRLKALEGSTKNTVWQNDQVRIMPHIPIVLADLNKNRLQDVVVVGQDGRLRALDGSNGAEIWLSPILGDMVSGPAVVNDLNGDDLPDVAICTRTGQVHIGYGDVFQMVWKRLETGLTIDAVPSSMDWDGDGRAEVFVGTDEGKLLIIDGGAGAVRSVFDFNQAVSTATDDGTKEHMLRYPIAMTDVNGNGLIDLVLASTSGSHLAIESNTFNRLWHEKLHNEFNFIDEALAPVSGNLNDDEFEDIVLISNRSLKVLHGAADSRQRKKVAWEYYADGDDFFTTPTTLVDLDKDGGNDVVMGSVGGSVFIFNGRSGKIIARFQNEGNPVVSPFLVADLEGNGHLDLIFRRKDGHIYTIQSNSRISENHVVWGQAYGNAQHTGYAAYAPPSSAAYNILAATVGLLFLAVGFITYRTKSARERKIAQNQARASKA
ncbi:MAG: FHA domain-containing protein [bacterium]